MQLFDVQAHELTVFEAVNSTFDNIKLMGFQHLWKECSGKGVVVAVIDSGCDVNHPDLKANIIGGMNLVDGQSISDIRDENGHGTHVAGIIAANGRIRGGAPDAKLLIIKVFDASGQCSTDRVIRALDYAVNWRGPNGEKVDVINMSLGGPDHHPLLAAAVRKAFASGMLVVCAAGNSGDGNDSTIELDYPAAYPETLSVGAIKHNFAACYFTNTNDHVEVAAPGEDIVSTYINSSYANMSGTSMACPHVAAFAACVIEKFVKRTGRKPTAGELKTITRLMTVDIGKTGLDRYTGYGFVTAYPSAALCGK
jgi:major intracellular serine protease